MGKWRPNTVRLRGGRKGVYLIKSWQSARPNQAHWAVECKTCGSENVVRFGVTPKGAQRFLCKECNHTFVDNNALPGMRYPPNIIASVLNLFYESSSLDKIRRQVQLEHNLYPGHATVYEWIAKYTKKAVKGFEGVTANTGDIWAADETVLRVGGSKTKEGADNTIWFWDVEDESSRFLLASYMSQRRSIQEVERLFTLANSRASRTPKFIITDKLSAYLDGIEKVFGADTVHVQSRGMRSSTHNNVIERFHGTIKDRTKVMRGMANKETARLVMDGWLVHYNYFRPHLSLKGKTPAQVAGVEAPYKNWREVVSDET